MEYQPPCFLVAATNCFIFSRAAPDSMASLALSTPSVKSRLKPLTMAEAANAVGVHETTVSRAVAGKYMRTPGGVFEMKYFFTPGIKTAEGEQISNKTVKDIIAGLVANEDPAKPLSDQAIMEELQKRGIKIARRTISKYRLVLRIPPSHLRKSYE